MRLFKLPVLFLMLASALFAARAGASDFAKEKRWADQVVDSILIGEPVWLKDGDHEFLAIYTEPTGDKAIGGAIVMHGIGVHPNWNDVVYPLRTGLPEAGWHTLSLQMPILENDADYKDYVPLFSEIAPRIDAGIDFLKEKGVGNIVLIGHSLGAAMAAYYFAGHDRPEVRALVMVGATGTHFHDPERDVVQSLKKIKKPVLDLSGSDDEPDVLATQEFKAEAAKEGGNDAYVQDRIEGANHFMVGKEDELVERVGEWIGQFTD